MRSFLDLNFFDAGLLLDTVSFNLCLRVKRKQRFSGGQWQALSFDKHNLFSISLKPCNSWAPCSDEKVHVLTIIC